MYIKAPRVLKISLAVLAVSVVLILTVRVVGERSVQSEKKFETRNSTPPPVVAVPTFTPQAQTPVKKQSTQVQPTIRVPTPTTVLVKTPVLKQDANIRQGPGLEYPIVQQGHKGRKLTVSGYAKGTVQGQAGRWLQVTTVVQPVVSGWVWEMLVDDVPSELEMVNFVPPATPAPVPTPTMETELHVCDAHFETQQAREDCWWRAHSGLELLPGTFSDLHETLVTVYVGRPDR